jgi:signal transduction histidine kinase
MAIADDAGGMSATMRDAILGGNAISTKSEGHGLGLRFVLDECRASGFELGIDAQEGLGTTFRVKMPAV